jgi:hypothetical protein
LGPFCAFDDFAVQNGAFWCILVHAVPTPARDEPTEARPPRALGGTLSFARRVDPSGILTNALGRSMHFGTLGYDSPGTSGVAPSIASSSAHRTAADCDPFDRSMTPLLSADTTAAQQDRAYHNFYRTSIGNRLVGLSHSCCEIGRRGA